MNKSLGQRIFSGIIGLGLAVSSMTPHRSHALAGAVMALTGNPSGLAVMAIGGLGVLTFKLKGPGTDDVPSKGRLFMFLMSFVALDEQGVLNYKKIDETQEKAEAIHVSLEDLKTYNSQVEELNLVKESLAENIAQNLAQGISESRSLESANFQWSQIKNTLHPATIRVAENLTKLLQKQ